jgi:hypothetical protein
LEFTHYSPSRATLSLEQLWTLSQVWYGNRLDENFHGCSMEQAMELFREAGLSGEFWNIE